MKKEQGNKFVTENIMPVITSHNVEQEVLKSVRSDVVIPNKLGNGETCQGLRHWRLLSNLKNNFSKPVRNDIVEFGGVTRHPEGDNPKDLSTNMNLKLSPEFVSDKNKLDCFAFARNDEKTVTNLFPYFPISLSLKKKVDSSPNALALNGYGFALMLKLVRLRMTAFTLAEGATHVDLPPTKVKFAFTLAEVLITLGIIGVVAAITIPGLMNNYKANKLRTQFLKTYSTVQQAFKFMQEDDVSLDPASYNRREGQVFYKTYKKYLKGITDCGLYTTEAFPCYNFQKEIYKTLNGKAVVDKFLFDDGQVVLQDGTLLAFEQPADGGNRIWVLADINGINNPPNRLGYDLFVFEFLDGELRTMGEKGTIFYNSNSSVYCSKTSTHPYNGMSCSFRAKSESEYFKWVVKNIK